VTDAIFLNVMANVRLIRLHSYFLRGYHDGRFTISKKRCLESAQTLLRLIDLAEKRVPTLLSFWVVLFYAFTAVGLG
jgi:hypothetical protein